jgi:hypothetical protein
MTDFARLVLDADTTGLKNAERDLQSVSRTASKSASEIGSSMQKLGVGLTVGVTAPLGFFAKGAAQAAIDAQEMESAFAVVFGGMADDVSAWAERTGDALGRSTQEIQRGALAFQELFGKALDPAQSAELSKQFTVLTQDLASFKNLSNEVAQQKLFSGLVGEAEPLRAVGVFLSENALQARAAAMGLGDFSKELTDQEKIVVRAAEIQAQLAMANGDVARTGDSTANQIRRSQAAFEELQITVGTKLLPVLTPLIEKLGAALEWFTSLPTPVQDTVLVVAGLAVALGPILTALGTLVTIAPAIATAFGVIKLAALGLMANPFILAFAAVLAGVYLAWQNWDKITAIVQRVYNGVKTWLQDKLGAVFNWLGQRLSDVTGFFFDMYDAVVGNSYVPDMVTQIGDEFRKLQNLMVDPAQKAAEGVTGTMQNMARDVSGLLARLFPEMEAARRQAEEISLLRESERGGIISAETRREGVRRLQGINEGPLAEVEKVNKAALELKDALAKNLSPTVEEATAKIGESFTQMADRTLQALDRMVGAIRGGGFLNILSSVVNLGIQLGGIGAFGKNVQTRINANARADGGQVNAGRTYLVGERGPELFSPASHGSITPNSKLQGGGMVINVDARGSTDPEAVRQQVERGILEAAPSIVAAAEQRTIATLRRPRLAGAM